MAREDPPCSSLIENAKKACENMGIVPKIQPIRGGTDGARLSFMGLPCPNLGTGGYAFHGPYEHITVEGMDKSVEILMELVKYMELLKRINFSCRGSSGMLNKTRCGRRKSQRTLESLIERAPKVYGSRSAAYLSGKRTEKSLNMFYSLEG